MSGTLYIVPTPIGNLEDVTLRAARILGEVDFIAAEDTRVTMKLLNHLNLRKPMVSYYEHNRAESGARIADRLSAGESGALVTDAGTPCISDPGDDLVRLCAERGLAVEALPGACAAVTALSVSGLCDGRFCFEGFLSVSKKSRKEHLTSIERETRTLVFYEAPHKLRATLADLAEHLGGQRRVVVCRELTKLHEEVLYLTLKEAVAHFEQTPPRGEFVLVIEGAEPVAEAVGTLEEAVRQALDAVAGGIPLREAARAASSRTGQSRNAVYEAVLRERGEH